MKLSTMIFIGLGGMVLLIVGITMYFIADYLIYFGLYLLLSFGLFLTGLFILSGLMFTEKYLYTRTQRKAGKWGIITDGSGQSYILDHDTGNLRSLTTNPSFHINGKASEPTQAELTMQALFFQAIGKGHAQSSNTPLLLPSTVESIPDLLPILDKAQRVLIKAASNGGKTTLLQHIADRRHGSVIVLDSQSYPDKWPSKCKVVGTGSDHAAISVALDNLIELMVKRYREIGEGLVKEGEHPRLTVIIDEWMAIVSECPNASDVIRRLLTESRKAAFSVFIGSHSERVKALGLDGRGDLRDGFLIIRVEETQGQFVATYDYGRGERPCQLPGEYQPAQTEQVFEIEAITEPIASDEDKKDREFVELVRRHMSRSDACQRVYGRKYAGSIVERCKRLLEE